MKFSRLALTVGALFAATQTYGKDAPVEGPASREWTEHFRVNDAVAPPPEGVTDLQFREFFTPGHGLRGRVPTEKLRSLAGKPVRLIGYMARPDPLAPGILVLAPRHSDSEEESEALALSTARSAAVVQVEGARQRPIAHLPGLLQFTGILELESTEEASLSRAQVRLRLDPDTSRMLLAASSARRR